MDREHAVLHGDLDVLGVHPEPLSRPLGVEEERAVDTGVAEKQAIPVDHALSRLERTHDLLGDVHHRKRVDTGLHS